MEYDDRNCLAWREVQTPMVGTQVFLWLVADATQEPVFLGAAEKGAQFDGFKARVAAHLESVRGLVR